ncbi:MAG: hypothetical protein C0507_17140 [Cyanobacteria bacterium PR.3.49]|jgi:hypothetical protein|nr:hypothetical protein [Cyanobacteria bacterium PR.3.49]
MSALSAVLFLSSCFPPPSLGRSADWVVTIKTNVVEKALNYPNSKLHPLIRTAVSFEQGLLEQTTVDKELAKKGGEPDIDIPQTLYEYHYSSHFRTVGMRRFKELIIKPGSTGVIRVSTSRSNLAQEEANAAASATVRLYLDLYMNKMPLRSIVVQGEIFDQFLQEMQRYGFRTFVVVPGQMVPALAVLNIRSEPSGRQQYLSYGL